MTLDDARDHAVELLRQLIVTEGNYHGFFLGSHADADEKMADLGRQFVTAQARYTIMLNDWEKD